MSDPNVTNIQTSEEVAANGGVSSVTVSVTVSGKPLGADAFIKMEETFAFAEPASDVDAIIKRDNMLEILRDQVLLQATSTAEAIRERVAQTPRGSVQVAPVQPAPAPAGTQANFPAPAGAGAAAVQAVANGATADAGDWMAVPSRFGDGEIRFMTTMSFPQDRLEAEVGQWLLAKGLNPNAFKVWDNRPGPKGLEAGVPNGCVATVKVGREAVDYVAGDMARLAVARVKFNANGTLYIWLTKEAEAALKYGALDALKVQQ